MEVLQTILMVVGAITLLWLVIKFAKGCLWLLGKMFEAGFRERYPYDYHCFQIRDIASLLPTITTIQLL